MHVASVTLTSSINREEKFALLSTILTITDVLVKRIDRLNHYMIYESIQLYLQLCILNSYPLENIIAFLIRILIQELWKNFLRILIEELWKNFLRILIGELSKNFLRTIIEYDGSTCRKFSECSRIAFLYSYMHHFLTLSVGNEIFSFNFSSFDLSKCDNNINRGRSS